MSDEKCPICGETACYTAGSWQCLSNQLATAQPYMDALRNRHNGYRFDEYPTPESPEAALTELIAEAGHVAAGEIELLTGMAAKAHAAGVQEDMQLAEARADADRLLRHAQAIRKILHDAMDSTTGDITALPSLCMENRDLPCFCGCHMSVVMQSETEKT